MRIHRRYIWGFAGFLVGLALGFVVFGYLDLYKPSQPTALGKPVGIYADMQGVAPGPNRYYLDAAIKPTSLTIADRYYAVTLYEHNTNRGTRYIEWSQAEINVKKAVYVQFTSTKAEYDAYAGLDYKKYTPENVLSGGEMRLNILNKGIFTITLTEGK